MSLIRYRTEHELPTAHLQTQARTRPSPPLWRALGGRSDHSRSDRKAVTRLRLTIAASCLLALLGCHEDGPVVSFTPTPDVSTLGPSDVDGGQPPGD